MNNSTTKPSTEQVNLSVKSAVILKIQICYNTRKKGEYMVAVKQEAQEMIQNLPDNCTYEDIQYHLYVVEKIKNGISRAENGEVSSHQDAKQRMAKWLSN